MNKFKRQRKEDKPIKKSPRQELPTQIVTLADCLWASEPGNWIYCNDAIAQARYNFDPNTTNYVLDREAANNYLLNVKYPPVGAAQAFTVVEAIARSPAAVHYVAQRQADHYVANSLHAAITRGVLSDFNALVIVGAYDEFKRYGEPNHVFYQHEVAYALVDILFARPKPGTPHLVTAFLDYPLTHFEKRLQTRDEWFSRHEAAIDEAIKTPLTQSQERTLARLVMYMFAKSRFAVDTRLSIGDVNPPTKASPVPKNKHIGSDSHLVVRDPNWALHETAIAAKLKSAMKAKEVVTA